MRIFKRDLQEKNEDCSGVSIKMIEFCKYLKKFTHSGEVEVKVIQTNNDYYYLSVVDYDPPQDDQEFDMSVDMLFLTVNKKTNVINSIENYFNLITPANKNELIMTANLIGFKILDIDNYLNKIIRNGEIIDVK